MTSVTIAEQPDYVIAMLQDKVTQLSTDFGHLGGEVSALRSDSAGLQTLSEEVSALKTEIEQKLNDAVVEQLSTDFIELRKEVLTLKVELLQCQPRSLYPNAVPVSFNFPDSAAII
jgi:archaellum component FlaC